MSEEWELTEAEQVIVEWHSELLDRGLSPFAAIREIELFVPRNGGKILTPEFRRWLVGM